MKKMVLIFMLCATFLGGCEKEVVVKENKNVIELTAEEASRKIQRGQDSFLLFLTISDCYSCKEYDKVLSKLQKESSFKIYYVNIKKEPEDKLNELNISLGDYETLPMTFYIDKGKISEENIKNGYIEKDEFSQWLKDLGIWK